MMKESKIRVAVAGGFDPLHIGHLRHLQKAKALGNHLIVLVSNDDDMIRKKGFCFMPIEERIEILKAISCVDEVIITVDKDGTQAETLKMARPDIFAKGGDRTPDNMPENEIKACEEIHCKIVYGVGERLASSSELLQKAAQASTNVESERK
ncbi:adenylyltransferase/cytidyltransferase family protein [Chloroflexota bacterium]